jgi:prepilin-type N-terminal cleavage/methylation domain-containing protein
MSARRGFTLIELLVVIAVIAALAGMSLAGLSVLRRQSKVASTLDLMTHVTTAVDAYLHEYRRLGNNPTTGIEFLQDPWWHFHKDQREHKKQPLLDVKLERLVEKTGPGSCKRPAAVHTATHITDFFGSTPGNVLSFTLVNNNKGSGPNTAYAHCIILRSSAGTVGDPKDDLFYAYSADKASWRKIKYDELVPFGAELDPVVTLNPVWVDPLSY